MGGRAIVHKSGIHRQTGISANLAALENEIDLVGLAALDLPQARPGAAGKKRRARGLVLDLIRF